MCCFPLEPPSRLPSHPTPLVVTEHQFALPESYSKFPPAVCFAYGTHVFVSIVLPPFTWPRVQKCVLYVCISIPTLQIGLSVRTLETPYICVLIYDICFSDITALCTIGSRFIHLIRTDTKCVPFNGWVLFHCTYVPQFLYLFICWWTSRLLLCPGYPSAAVSTGYLGYLFFTFLIGY